MLTVTPLLARRGWVPVLAGLGYWILLGIPVLIVGVGRLLGHSDRDRDHPGGGRAVAVRAAQRGPGGARRPACPGPIQRLRGRAGPAEPKRLRTQLFHQLVPLTAIPLALLGLGLGGLFARAAERGASADLADRVRLVGHRVGDIVAEHESALRAAAGRLTDDGAGSSRSPSRGALALAQEQRLRPHFTSLLLTNPAGRVLAGAGECRSRGRPPAPAPGRRRRAISFVLPEPRQPSEHQLPASYRAVVPSIRGSRTIR